MMSQPAPSETSGKLPLDDLPVDVERLADTTNTALSHELSTTTRVQIDSLTLRLVGHLNLLLQEELGADEDSEVREMFREAYKLLDLSTRPTPNTPVFGSFIYMRDLASVTRKLLWVYAQSNTLDVP